VDLVRETTEATRRHLTNLEGLAARQRAGLGQGAAATHA
jgi:hypothetical protein